MISKEERDTGRFFGEIDWLVMDSLIHYGVYKRYDNITVKPLLLVRSIIFSSRLAFFSAESAFTTIRLSARICTGTVVLPTSC